PALPAAASVVIDGAGVRFDFDRRSRVVPPALARIRRVRTTAWGLRGIDLRLEPGAGLALVGPTGSGKTTLLRVLAGVMQPDEAFDRPIHTYSMGMRARLHLAAIQSISAHVLLLDEAFEALDHEFRGIIEVYGRELRERGGIVVAAGHDHAALERLCPRAVW